MYQANKLISVRYPYCWTVYQTSIEMAHTVFRDNFKRKRDALAYIALHE